MKDKEKKRRLSLWLSVAMVFTMIMGPGPGLRLVNPGINDPIESYLFMGVPVIYAWGIFWFIVQLSIVTTAYYTVWASDEAPASTN